MRPKLIHGIILTLAALGGLFYLKYRIEEKEIQLEAMKAQYMEDQKALRVLKAEWTYLNSPDYLQDLADKYLTLKPVASKEVVAWFDRVPKRYQPEAAQTIAMSGGSEDGALIKASVQPPGRADEP